MILSEICIKRPVLAWVMTLIITLLGIVAFYRLPIQYLPKIEHPIVTIETQLAGSSGSVVEQSVTQVIEEAVSGIDGIDFIQSNSSLGESKITMQFMPDKSIDRAVEEIRDKLFKIKQDLPAETPNSTITRSGTTGNNVLSLVLMGENHTLGELADFAKNEIEKELESISGVSQVNVSGAGLYKMHVYLDPSKLATYNVTVKEVMEAIRRHNFEVPAGQIRTGDREYTVTAVSNLEKPIEFENMTILERESHVIKIRDVGHVEMTPEEKQTRARYNGKRVINIQIFKQNFANPLSIADNIKKKLPILKNKLHSNMELEIGYDGTKFIRTSINQVYKTIIEAIIFVSLIVLFFLQSFRAAIIPFVTIPISLIGTFIVIYLFGFTINMFSLAAMVLAIGLVVDDAIVVLENIDRYIKKGLKPFDAAFKGIKEIGFAIIAMTLTLAAVYAPTALAEGLTGKLMIEFSLTLATSVIISGFVALTLSPMMCARILQTREQEEKERSKKSLTGWLHRNVPIEKWLHSLEVVYEKYLNLALHKKLLVLSSSFLFAFLCFGLYQFIPKTLLPQEDKGLIDIAGEAPQTATLEFTDRYVKLLDEKLQTIPEIEKRTITIENVNRYKVNITLKDKRKRSLNSIIKSIEHLFSDISGINARVQTEDNSDMIQFALRGNKDVKQLNNYAFLLSSSLSSSGLFQTNIPLTSQKGEQEEFMITIDPKVDALKIDPRTVAEIVEGLIRGKKSTQFKKDNRLYDVMVEVEDKHRRTVEDILKIYVKPLQTNQQKSVRIPLGELINIESKMGYPNILHLKKTRMVDQAFKLKSGVGLPEAVSKVKESAQKVLPEDIYLEFIGETKKFIEETNIMIFIFILALCFIYLVLAAQFESWRDPFTIILSVPLSLAGAIIALSLFKEPKITLWANIGFVTLIGLITKHGIMIVDFANKLREENLSIQSAIIQSSKLRLRPILMTTSAMILGSVPLLFVAGPTKEANAELGAVIIGGLALGTLFTLFVVPCVYCIVTKKQKITHDIST